MSSFEVNRLKPRNGDTVYVDGNISADNINATNANDIDTNTNNIATNANDIATNANDIAANANDIATNAGSIASHSSDYSLHLTSDQNSALDGANAPGESNPLATMQDVVTNNRSTVLLYHYEIANNISNEWRLCMDTDDPTTATELLASVEEARGLHISGILSRLNDGDNIILSSTDNATISVNFRVTGDPVYDDNNGTPVMRVPVGFIDKTDGDEIPDLAIVTITMFYGGASSDSLLIANNLSDLNSYSAARANLNVYDKSTVYTQSQVDSGFVALTGDQAINDIKTFNTNPVVPTPINSNHASSKGYTDTIVNNHKGDYSLHLTSDQNDAFDGANAPSAGNPVATIDDLSGYPIRFISDPFSVSTNSLYVKTHNISGEICSVEVQYRLNSSYRWTSVPQFEQGGQTGCVYSVDSVDVKIHTLESAVAHRPDLVGGGDTGLPTSGEYRVILIGEM